MAKQAQKKPLMYPGGKIELALGAKRGLENQPKARGLSI